MRRARVVFSLVAIASFVAVASAAHSHAVGISRSEARLDGDVLRCKLILARPDAILLVPRLDANGDGVIDETELDFAASALTPGVLDHIGVSAGDERVPATLDGFRLVESDGLELEASWRVAASTQNVEVRMGLLDDLPISHRHLAHAIAASGVDEISVLSRDEPTFSMARVEGGRAHHATFFALGATHVLAGWDHLLFLLGLVVVAARARSLLAVVTAFTVGHSLSLALAAMGILAPSPRIIEPLIAASIAYVGIENLVAARVQRRWLLALAFGFIHGFGFAGALLEVEMPRSALPLALLTFNLGVEAGQLMALAAIVPLGLLARSRDSLRMHGPRVVSAVIAGVGVVLTIVRIVR